MKTSFRTTLFALAIAGITCVSFSGTGSAQQSKEVNIEADQMQVQEKMQQATFTGNVDAKRGDLRLRSDKLVVHYQEKPKTEGGNKTDVTILEANGNVSIITPKQHITGDWARMDVKANRAVVGGGVQVRQGDSVVSGSELHIDLNTNESRMEGGRVKGSFSPN